MGSNQSNETSYCMSLNGPDEQATTIPVFCKFDEKPFSKGAVRYCYQGQLFDCHGKPTTLTEYPNGKCVAKIPQVKPSNTSTTSDDWVDDLKNAYVANTIAEKFNSRFNTSKPIQFKVPLLAKMEKRAGFKVFGVQAFKIVAGDAEKKIQRREHVTIEPFIEGNYEKITSNSGYVNNEFGNTAPAFMHYSWIASGGQLVVSDLQGVKTSTGYILTDPAIQSVDHSFGATDLGVEGIMRFLATHKHNVLCQDLDYPAPSEFKEAAKRVTMSCVRGSTFRSQITSSPLVQSTYVAFLASRSGNNSKEEKALPTSSRKFCAANGCWALRLGSCDYCSHHCKKGTSCSHPSSEKSETKFCPFEGCWATTTMLCGTCAHHYSFCKEDGCYALRHVTSCGYCFKHCKASSCTHPSYEKNAVSSGAGYHWCSTSGCWAITEALVGGKCLHHSKFCSMDKCYGVAAPCGKCRGHCSNSKTSCDHKGYEPFYYSNSDANYCKEGGCWGKTIRACGRCTLHCEKMCRSSDNKKP